MCGVDNTRFLIPAGTLRQCCGVGQSALPGFGTCSTSGTSQVPNHSEKMVILLSSSGFLTLIFLRDFGLSVACPCRSFVSVCMCGSVFVSVNHTRHCSAGLGCAFQGEQSQALCACLWKLGCVSSACSAGVGFVVTGTGGGTSILLLPGALQGHGVGNNAQERNGSLHFCTANI